jgi:hypothetical protein
MARSSRPFRFAVLADVAQLAEVVCLIIAIGSGHALNCNAQEALDGTSEDPSESLTSWQYFQELPLPAETESEARWYDLVLTTTVFDAARLDLADLRLFDAAQREVPYAMRIRKPEFTREELTASEFNRTEGPENSSELSLDLGTDKVEHNEVELHMAGEGFRRRAELEGSDDASDWRQLAEQFLIRFQRGNEELHDRTITYPPSRYRYLRVRLFQDPVVDEKPVEIESALVYHRVEVPGELITRNAQVGPREPVRADGAPGSAWVLDLGGNAVPCEQIAVEIANADFVRDYYIEAAGPPDSGEPFYRISSGTWRRQAGEEIKNLIAEFSEVTAARLKLVVIDYRNPPLDVGAITYSAPVRQVVFSRAESLAGPVRLYFGNPHASAPRYDFARNLPQRLQPPPDRLDPGPRQENPTYTPEPLPLTERWPWLIYVVLGTTITVLGALIASLGRAAINDHDGRQSTTQAGEQQ